MSPRGLRENAAPKSVPSVASMVLIAILSIIGIAYCGVASQQHPTPSPAPAPANEVAPAVVVEPIDKGNGIFYFPVTGDAYVAALVKFYENGNGDKHCDLQGATEEVSWVEARWRFPVSRPTGFILHCHDIALEAQEITRE